MSRTHLSVGEIIDDSDAPERLPDSEQRLAPTAAGAAKVATISEFAGERDGAVDGAVHALAVNLALDSSRDGIVDAEAFASTYHPGRLLLLALWRDARAAGAWSPDRPELMTMRHRRVLIGRDYGMFDRCQAPQHFQAVVSRPLGE